MAPYKRLTRVRQHLRSQLRYWKWVVGNCQCSRHSSALYFPWRFENVDFCVEKGWLKNTVWIEFLNFGDSNGSFCLAYFEMISWYSICRFLATSWAQREIEEWHRPEQLAKTKSKKVGWTECYESSCESTLQGTNISLPPWEKENHLQNPIFGGYVSSLEGRCSSKSCSTL